MKISSPILKSGALVFSLVLLLLVRVGTAHASGSISIGTISPGTTVTPGTTITFPVTVTSFANPNPTYSLSDSFIGGGLGSYNINSSGNFSWTPAQNDVGTHSVVITVQDNSGDYATANLTFTVIPVGTSVSAPVVTPAISIQSLEPSSIVTAGQSVSFTTSVSGFSGTPAYAVRDSFTGTSDSLISSVINSSGVFFWTPTPNDAGVHSITVIATDSSGTTAQNSVSITVEPPTVSVVASTTTVAPTFTETLSSGSSDAQVTALQNLLTKQGYLSATVTGYYGAQTVAAVKKFQTANSIQPLGIVGPATRTALNALVSPTATGTTPVPATTTTSSSGPTISQIKSEVQSLEAQINQLETQLSQLIGQ